MSRELPEVKNPNDAEARHEHTIRALMDGLEILMHKIQPITNAVQQEFGKVAEEVAAHLQPLAETLEKLAAAAAPFVQAAAREMERLDSAESLLRRGWVPNRTTPFDLAVECGDDITRLNASMLAHYTDNWTEVRKRLESRMSSRNVDDEAMAVFREALDAHEAGLYRSVSRLLFPEFERVFRKALFGGQAGHSRYQEFIKELTGRRRQPAGAAESSPASKLDLADFLTAGLQDMVLFGYLTEGSRSDGRYKPGLAVRIDEENVEEARQSPIPTRHAVVHGLVSYSSQQSSLNAIFIADYVFSFMFGAVRDKLGFDAEPGDGSEALTPQDAISPAAGVSPGGSGA